MVPPCNKRKWIWSWKNTMTSSPHPQGYLCTVRSNIQSIWLPEHLYLIGRYIVAPFWKMKRSHKKSRCCCKKGTSDQVPCFVGAWLYLHRRRMSLEGSALITGYYTKSLSGIGIQSNGLMTFWTNSRGPSILARSIWTLAITRFQ